VDAVQQGYLQGSPSKQSSKKRLGEHFMESRKSISEVEKIQKELLWELHQEFRDQAKHNETMRSNVINYTLVVVSALITVITFNGKVDRQDVPLSVVIILIGIFSTLFSAAYTERYHRNRAQASALLKHLDALFFEGQAPSTISQIRANAEEKHFRYKLFSQLRQVINTHWLWISFPFIVAIIGFVLTLLAWFSG
jgi:hypothetical protein